METELKLKVPADELERLRRHPMLLERALGEPVEHHLVDTYYDTPERALWKAGLTLRVRADGGRWIQTVKTAGDASGSLHRRGEWECALPDAQPRPDLVARQVKPAAMAELLRSAAIAADLAPLFQNTTHRTTWRIALEGGQELECALDAGSIAAGARQASIAELALELKEGDPAQLFRLALDLHHEVPLQLAGDSKAARGYALLDAAPLRAHKAAPVRLRARMTLEQAFVAIGANCLAQLESNVPGVLKRDVESLHQMRVGLRRLRALVDMFDELVQPPAAVREGLDWLAGELGAARDWDVLAGSTLERIAGLDPAALRQAAQAKAEAHHRQLAQTLRAPHFTGVLLQVGGWLHGRAWRAGDALAKDTPLAAPAGRGMRPLLRKAEKRLDKRIDGLDTADAHARHRTRIAAKKARYAAEFFQDLLPAKRVKPYVGRLSKLQDRLGMLNDYSVADRLLDALKGSNAQVARQAAYARGYLAASTAARSDRLGKALASVAGRRVT
ncbi:CHAD domain-containing protein [Massilia sp. YIM B02769]|uniref:CYTH and CHAD domain-containing protein n=1 Tax=unclassified Massilia TaxID=2609279 RepID=UPI0025B698DD|nr:MULTISPECIES: CYTH and CHAD domain-containing protein [unclassified Massilia]MDN4059106.1 CHAD domain-containing protein [Massilia sp. YIM B02769]